MMLLFVGSLALIVYAFAGYPAVMALLARTRPRPVRSDPEYLPSVSLIIVAYNEQDVIETKLRNTADLDYPAERLEVVVITDGSDDATPDKAREHAGVRVLHRPERAGKLAAMNRAATEARGEILVYSDANNAYSRDAIRRLVAPLADEQVGVVTGRKAIDDGSGRALDRAEGLYWRYESLLKTWETASGSVTAVAGEILAFRRAAFVEPPRGTMNDDFVQAMLAAADGWRVVYVPEALSLEPASATIEDEAVRRSRLVTGRGQALRHLMPVLVRRDPRLAWQVVSHKGLRPVVPWALVCAAVSNALLLRSRRWAWWLGTAQALFYGAAGVGMRQARRGGRSRLTYLPYYFCRMNAATLRGTRDYLRGRHDHVWQRVERGPRAG